jgi:hypothetical protein
MKLAQVMNLGHPRTEGLLDRARHIDFRLVILGNKLPESSQCAS